jgi:outer membrane receptor for ferrienterochelin and colicins
MKFTIRFSLAAVLLILALVAVPALAQQKSQLTVNVSERGGVVPRAVVTLVGPTEGEATRRVTDDGGRVIFGDLAPGTYKIKVNYVGFAPYAGDSFELAAGEQKTVDVVLTLAQFSGEITITTANRREELLRNVAEPTTLISAADIADTGGESAKEVLIEQAGSGVVVSPHGATNSVSINGLGGSAVLILVDGRRYLGRNSLGDVNLEDIDLSNVERVEIVKGAGSAMYGSDAMAGVINFITKKPTDFGVTNSLDLAYGSYSDARFSDTLGYRRGDFSGSLTASYRNFDGYDLNADTVVTEGEPASKRYVLSGNMEYRVTDRIRTRLFADYNFRDITEWWFAGATQMGPMYNNLQELTRYSFSPEVDLDLAPSTSVNLLYNFGRYHRDETREYTDGSTEVIDPWVETNNEFKATARHAWMLAGAEHYLQFGYEFRNERLERGSLTIPGTDSKEADRDINVLWAQNEFNLFENFKFNVGFRYDDYSDFGNEFSPKLSAVYAITDENRVRFTYGHGFRAPMFGELYLDLGFFFKGNPDLQPETSDNFTFGLAHTSQYVIGSFDIFYNKIKDGIAFDLSVFPYTYNNLENFAAKGFNSAVAIILPYGFTPEVSYTFVDRKDENGEKILGYPDHTAFFKLLWFKPQTGTRVNLRAQFIDKIPYDDGTERPGYQVWYLKGSQKLFTTDTYTFGFFAQIDNLFDKSDVYTRDAMGNAIPGDFGLWLAPRTFRAGITIDMDWIGARR